MGSLEDFAVKIKDMIRENNLNVSVSGVALIVTESRDFIYSASLIVETDGQVPKPDIDSIASAYAALDRAHVRGYSLRYVQYVSALFKDEKLLRWQAQYVVSDNE